MKHVLGFAALIPLVSACASPSQPAVIPCSADAQCPEGQICVAGLCAVPDERDGGRARDGGALDGGTAGSDGGIPTRDGGAPDGGGAADGGGAVDADGAAPDGGGAFGSACQNGRDCASGICIQTSTGGVCTRLCSQDCPTDWGCRLVNLAPVCVPPELTVCAACDDDAGCGGAYRCTEYAGAKVCLRECAGPSDCTGTQTCRAIDQPDGGSVSRCVPTNDPDHCGACGHRCGAGPGVQCCGDRCVNLLTDESACGTSCASAVACAPGQSCCGGACVDTRTSGTHCGACLGEGGTSCTGPDERCCDGACVTVRDNPDHCGSCAPCEGGRACCGLTCVDLGSDPGHCRSCGSSCQPSQACCGAEGCTTVADNDRHCGACGNDCIAQFGASAGNCCGSVCANKLTDKDRCGDACAKCIGTNPACCAGTCADLANDPQHCGACSGPGSVCGAGETCCGTAASPPFCRNLQTDPLHCGACNRPCGDQQSCCAGQCRSTQSDPDHCGACGNVCSREAWPNVTGYGCASGRCTIASCASTFYDIDGVTTNGCECRSDELEPNGFSAASLWAARDVLDLCRDENGDPCSDPASDDGYQVVIDANLAPGTDSDFYRLRVKDELFHNWEMRITLTFSPSISLDLAVYRWNGSSWVAYDGTYSRQAGQVTFRQDSGPGDTAHYGFEVKRTGSDATCGAYRLELKDLF